MLFGTDEFLGYSVEGVSFFEMNSEILSLLGQMLELYYIKATKFSGNN